MFLTGTLLNAATVLLGTAIGLLLGARFTPRVQSSVTTGIGLFLLAIAMSMALAVFTDPVALAGDDLAVLGAVVLGVAIGEVLRLHDRLESLGAWFQRRLARGGVDAPPSRIAEGFVTASLVFCVGPLTILGSLANGLTGDIELLAVKSMLDGVAAIAFAAALGPGVGLSVLTVLVVQGGLAGAAFLLRDVLDPPTVVVLTATGGVILLGLALRLLELKPIRVANFLPALVLAPIFVRVAALVRDALGG
jgi:uncharacterized protein